MRQGPIPFSEHPWRAALGGVLLFVLAGLAVLPSPAFANDVYIAESAAGAGTGADCADAYADTFFNNAGNWGSGPGQIGPGATVHLCGVITDKLAAKGSGVAGHPITILFESGAKISVPYCTSTKACLQIGDYTTVNGGTNGIIESTANGTNLANQQYSYGIWLSTYDTIENLTIQNLYVHDNTTDDVAANLYVKCITGDSGLHPGITVNKVTCNNAAIGMDLSGNNLTVSNSSFTYVNWAFSIGGPAGAAYGNVSIYNNQGGHFEAWDGTGPNTAGTYHHNFIHAYGSGSQTVTGLSIYNNSISYTGRATTSALLYSESSITINDLYLFNNVVNALNHPASSYIYPTSLGDTWYILNNTVIGAYPTGSDIQGACMDYKNGTNVVVQNNLITTCGGSNNNLLAGTMVTFAAGGIDYNLYANTNPGASSPWGYNGTSIATFGAWQTANGRTCGTTGLDCHGSYRSSAGLSASGVPQAVSPANHAGVNLTSLCSIAGLSALCQDAVGNARPALGAWGVGAYEFTSQLQPPSGLTVLVH